MNGRKTELSALLIAALMVPGAGAYARLKPTKSQQILVSKVVSDLGLTSYETKVERRRLNGHDQDTKVVEVYNASGNLCARITSWENYHTIHRTHKAPPHLQIANKDGTRISEEIFKIVEPKGPNHLLVHAVPSIPSGNELFKLVDVRTTEASPEFSSYIGDGLNSFLVENHGTQLELMKKGLSQKPSWP